MNPMSNYEYYTLMALLLSSTELLLFIQFKNLKKKLRKLRGTGRVPAIEVAYRWKLLIEILLFSIPSLALYMVAHTYFSY